MENYEKHYREIEKLTDNPFLNLQDYLMSGEIWEVK